MDIVVFGNLHTGKTQLINRFVNHEFDPFNYQPTSEHVYKHTKTTNNTTVELRILDTQGLQNFYELRKHYISSCHAMVIVYDVTSPSSVNGLIDLIEMVAPIRHPQQIPIVLVGTHKDQMDQIKKTTSSDSHRYSIWRRLVSSHKDKSSLKKMEETVDNAQKLADQCRIPHFIVSSKTGEMVEEAFLAILPLKPTEKRVKQRFSIRNLKELKELKVEEFLKKRKKEWKMW